jgi:hypothetical protein
MWRRGKAKSAKRLAALGLLQDAMGRVEQERAVAQDAEDPATAMASDRGDARPGRARASRRGALTRRAPHQEILQQQVPSQPGPPRGQQGPPREASTTGTGGAGR